MGVQDEKSIFKVCIDISPFSFPGSRALVSFLGWGAWGRLRPTFFWFLLGSLCSILLSSFPHKSTAICVPFFLWADKGVSDRLGEKSVEFHSWLMHWWSKGEVLGAQHYMVGFKVWQTVNIILECQGGGAWHWASFPYHPSDPFSPRHCLWLVEVWDCGEDPGSPWGSFNHKSGGCYCLSQAGHSLIILSSCFER